jgi:hypothetical protein
MAVDNIKISCYVQSWTDFTWRPVWTFVSLSLNVYQNEMFCVKVMAVDNIKISRYVQLHTS